MSPGWIPKQPKRCLIPHPPEILKQLLDRLPREPATSDQLAEVFGAFDPAVIAATSGGKEMLKSLALGELGEGRMARLT